MSRRHLRAPPDLARAALLAGAVLASGLAAGPAAATTTYGPDNTVTVVDGSPVNWLSITWNTMEEAVRVDADGNIQPGLATSWRWVTPTVLELKLRHANYQDGTAFTAANFKESFDKVQSWNAPHPPGTFLNYDKRTTVTIVDPYTVRMNFPAPDSAVFMKLRGMHIGSTAFWKKLGFVDQKTGSANGHW